MNKLNIESLKIRRDKNDLVFLFKIINKYVDINFCEHFKTNNYARNLRRHKHHISRQDVAQSQIRNNYFSYRVIKNWNSLPEDIISSETLDIFKHKLKRHILSP